MINELDLLWLPNFIALGIYLVFGTKFSWNEGIDTCFNVECMLLGHNFDFLGGYYLLSSGYCLLLGGYWWLLLLGLLLLVPTFSMNARNAGSHRMDRKFHKSQQILNQIKRNINKLCLGKISCQKAVRINFTWICIFANILQTMKTRKCWNQQKAF